MRLNSNSTVGVHEFPPFRAATRGKKLDKLETSVISLARGQNSAVVSDENSDIFSPMRSQQSQFSHLSSVKTQIGGFSYLENPPDPRQNYYADFPDLFSPAWQEGFIWKGVYLKLYSKNKAQQLKRELKVLKHMGVEYLQTETLLKLSEAHHSISLNPNESLDASKPTNLQILNILLPLICTIESSSWVLLGTPVLPTKKGQSEDQALKFSNEISTMFKNTFLLNNVTHKNFKVYHKGDDSVTGAPPGNILPTGVTHGSYLSGAGNIVNNNTIYLILSNVSRILVPLPKASIMMIIGQEINSNISFLEAPKKGLRPEMIKKILGYSDEDIATDALFVDRSEKRDSKDNQSAKVTDQLHLEILNFKRRGWQLQMIYVTSSKALPPTFAINKRANNLLNESELNR